MKIKLFLHFVSFFLFLLFFVRTPHAGADTTPSRDTFRIGFIGSLSSFAANYGTAVLEGAELAVAELKQEGVKVELKVEDDQSATKNTVSAYTKLKEVDHADALIGGSWWANAIVKQAERDRILLASCETLYNDDAVAGKTYFILNGDLRNWIRVYEPLIEKKGWKRGAIIRFVSGFGATLAREMETVFSGRGREFAGAVEYSDIAMPEVANVVMQLKKLKPDVVYIDAQPSSLANLLKKFAEVGMEDINILTNSIAEDVRRDKLFDLSKLKNLYFTKRSTFDEDFSVKFKKKYGKDPYLNADLGYHAVFLLVKALESSDPVLALKSGIVVHNKSFSFDEHNVYSGIRQEIFQVRDGSPRKLLELSPRLEE
jgi:branched-chain amino acid transport system substrate-binding protein